MGSEVSFFLYLCATGTEHGPVAVTHLTTIQYSWNDQVHVSTYGKYAWLVGWLVGITSKPTVWNRFANLSVCTLATFPLSQGFSLVLQ